MALSAPIYRLKRTAKLLSRDSDTPLNQALDHIAKKEGYENWSLLVHRNSKQRVAENPRVSSTQITALPLDLADRAEFIAAANEVFESVLNRIDAENPGEIRKLWDAENYIDELLLTEDMLPIERDYALSLIDAFLVHHVIDLAGQADHLVQKR